MLAHLTYLLALCSPPLFPPHTTIVSTPFMLQASKPATPLAQRQKLTPAEIFKKNAPYIVTIQTEDTTGTGFIMPNGHLFTANHVVTGKKSIKAIFPDKRSIDLVWVIAMHPLQDWIGFHTMETSKLAVRLTEIPEVGSKVIVIGSPRGLDQTITEGLMSGKRTVGKTELYQVSAAVSPGSSGSPLFDDYGDVIGLVSSKLGESEQLTFAVPTSQFTNRIGIPINAITPTDEEGTTIVKNTFEKDYTKWIQGTREAGVKSSAEDLQFLDSITVSTYLNDDAKKHIGETEVLRWVKSQLEFHCPRLKLASDDTNDKRAKSVIEIDTQTSFLYLFKDLASWDILTRSMRISIESLDGDPISCYTIESKVQRGGIGIAGRYIATTFEDGTFGFFGKSVDIRETWKNSIAKQISSFAEKWNNANPSKND